jgi:hypothetical protein
MELDGFLQKVAFGVDGSSITVEKDEETRGYRISPIQSSSNNDTYKHPLLSMEFIPLQSTQQSVSSHRQSVSSHLRYYRKGDEWILDEQERQVLWVPPDLRDAPTSHSCGKVAVLGHQSGRVIIANLSDVQH